MFRVPVRRTALLAGKAVGMSRFVPAAGDPAPPLTAAEQRDLVPAYFFPDLGADQDNPTEGQWTKMCHVANPGSIIIANDHNGDRDFEGAVADPEYVRAVEHCQNRGYKVVSYVATTYGEKPRGKLKIQVRNQLEWYQPDGIFLDEMLYYSQRPADGVSAKEYYTEISKVIRSGPRNSDGSVKMVIGNPGNVIEEQGDWALRRPPWWSLFRKHPVLDILIAVEKEAADYKNWPQPNWLYPGNDRARAYRFAHMVHGANSIPVSDEHEVAIAELSREHHAGYVYVTTEEEGTDATDPHRDPILWNELAPSWFSRLGPLPLPPVQ